MNLVDILSNFEISISNLTQYIQTQERKKKDGEKKDTVHRVMGLLERGGSRRHRVATRIYLGEGELVCPG